MATKAPLRKPEWIRTRIPSGDEWKKVDSILTRRGLHTVCDEARCPNKAECWGCGTATFMILGDVCTRGCSFCAVATGRTGTAVREEEAEELAGAVAELGLRYAVLTSVDRDDLADKGSAHFARCVAAIKERNPGVKVEVLIPDFGLEEIGRLAASGPDVVAHNPETVRRLQRVRDSRASFDRSLATLALAKEAGAPLTKSSLMLGIGETRDEILEAMDELRGGGVDILVLGQYLRPSARQIEVVEYIEPAAFAALAEEGRARGFSTVVAAPFARTSYHAMEAWTRGREGGKE
ncbi:MAG: lipoyl synthase [Treponema sp. GWB1_62_6]|nr:MAG: lipoyl synthase [Treponema sp. GWA1_62_8]OHE63323.1 MAG: lipoyl synthase [Treponema sp. GWC1_61_84]OHE69192.1 MAG: lipoyl synthase [Treponema sp. RIFOXYC1_FULL_61_9]OHE72350.1 MAG: lipoyl synthase [Treponema sp. GWB1_62_6]